MLVELGVLEQRYQAVREVLDGSTVTAVARRDGVARQTVHQAWGPSMIVWPLEREGFSPLPGRSSVYRALVRHGLVAAEKRRRKHSGYTRWERGRSALIDTAQLPAPRTGCASAQVTDPPTTAMATGRLSRRA